MEYIKNDTGDIKVVSDKGKVKWFPLAMVENTRLMKTYGFTVVTAPAKYEPVNYIKELTEEQKEAIENGDPITLTIDNKENVADEAPAKRGRKSKTN